MVHQAKDIEPIYIRNNVFTSNGGRSCVGVHAPSEDLSPPEVRCVFPSAVPAAATTNKKQKFAKQPAKKRVALPLWARS
jgi:hypothetical protein